MEKCTKYTKPYKFLKMSLFGFFLMKILCLSPLLSQILGAFSNEKFYFLYSGLYLLEKTNLLGCVVQFTLEIHGTLGFLFSLVFVAMAFP